MRIFFQGKGESVIINDEISVTVIEVDGDEVILGVDAPEWMELGENEIGSSEEEARLSNPLRPR